MVLMTVGHSLHRSTLMVRTDTMRAAPAARPRATCHARTGCSAAGRSETVRIKATLQHCDTWARVWQMQVTDAFGCLLGHLVQTLGVPT